MLAALQRRAELEYCVGGQDVIVEIDETLLNRVKPASAAFRRLRRRRAQIWAWGAIERLGIESGRFVIVLLSADLEHPRGATCLRACLENTSRQAAVLSTTTGAHIVPCLGRTWVSFMMPGQS